MGVIGSSQLSHALVNILTLLQSVNGINVCAVSFGMYIAWPAPNTIFFVEPSSNTSM